MIAYRARRETTAIVLHDSHSPPSLYKGATYLLVHGRQLGLLTIGFHFVIDRDGEIVKCRPHHLIGSHSAARNHDTIGVCLVGGSKEATYRCTKDECGKDMVDCPTCKVIPGEPEDNFTAEQMVSLKTLVLGIRALYGPIDIKGHGEVMKLKQRACPCIDMKEVRALCRNDS